MFLRCSRPLCSSQPTGGTDRIARMCSASASVRRAQIRAFPRPRSLRTQQRAWWLREGSESSTPRGEVLVRYRCCGHLSQCSTHERPPREHMSLMVALGIRRCQMLLRKEVIQPHLPVRLPCYDLVLITDPTFDGSLQKVGPPASGVTDFHDLTGGVYKARERIHRDVADSRLLATPTS